MALAAAIEAFAVKDVTPVRVNAYLDALKDIPVPLLNAAVRRSIQTRQWFPKVAELRADAEVCRRELLDAHPYERCAACNHTGTVRLPSLGQRPRYGRCKCWTAYQERMATLGISEKPVARLTAAEVPEEPTQEPALDDLPPALSNRIRSLSHGKGLG